jgi:DNA-binding transcriptional regulator YiaG
VHFQPFTKTGVIKVVFKTPLNASMSDVHPSTKNLKELRLQVGLTQHKLSQILDVRLKTVSDWERGLKQPRMSGSKFLLLCQTLDCSLEELVAALQESNKASNLPESKEKEEKQLVAA